MSFARTFAMVGSLVLVMAASTVEARTVGQVIDDATVVAEIKAKLAADKISNLVHVGVKADSGVVTLSGTVDSPERRARAAQIASGINGVKGVINDIQVKTASTVSPASPSNPPPGASPTVEVTGSVAQVNAAAKTVKLQDGRVLKITDSTVVWQPTAPAALKPGDQVLLRGVEFVGFQPTAPGPQGGAWQMGTVNRADPTTGQIVLSDGTVVRVTSATDVHRGGERVTLDRIAPGSEIVFHASSTAGSSEGSAFPRQDRVAPIIEASEVNVISTPAPWRR